MARTSSNPKAEKPYSVHRTACVDSGARIGDGCCIWHYSHVSEKAVIGAGSVLGQNVYIGPGVEIGSHVHIQNNVSVYQGVILEDYVFCGPSVVFTNMVTPRCENLDNQQKIFVRTLVQRGATLGANATIMCGVEIGRYAMIGAGSVVTRSVPDYALVLGVPARLHGWVCRCGAQLPLTLDPQSDESAACFSCRKHYIKTGYLIRET